MECTYESLLTIGTLDQNALLIRRPVPEIDSLSNATNLTPPMPASLLDIENIVLKYHLIQRFFIRTAGEEAFCKKTGQRDRQNDRMRQTRRPTTRVGIASEPITNGVDEQSLLT